MQNDCVFRERCVQELSYLHPLDGGTEALPEAFTFPFRYTPHPLCMKAATLVQDKLTAMGVTEGKMYGVLVGRFPDDAARRLFFLAAYSGQLAGSYAHPWFVPPVVDYLDPDSYFQREQAEIMATTMPVGTPTWRATGTMIATAAAWEFTNFDTTRITTA